MTDRSRRDILRSAGALGVLGLGSGAGTYALLGDSESFLLSSIAGTLDLQLATAMDAGTPTDFESTSNAVLSFPTFSPEESASGTATVALRSCTNPAWGSLQSATVGSSPLADHIDVVLTYSRRCGDSDSDSAVLYEGPLDGLDAAVGGGLPLSTADCAPLGKLEFDEEAETLSREDGPSIHIDDLPHTFQFDAGILTVTGVNTDDGKVVGLDVETGELDLCTAYVKGGGKQAGDGGSGSDADDDGVVEYRLGCADSATGLDAGTTPAGTQSGLSHVAFDICDGETHCIPCETPACVTMDWQYEPPKPKKLLESVANETLELVLEFGARQCRHGSREEP